ncbi:MAG: 2-oxo acid dehydrogenase subunit E2, partial [Actinomycetota bacterium]
MTTRPDFGPNAWLIEEMYRSYVEDPESVSETWREFFEDYEPREKEALAAEPSARETVPERQPAEPAPKTGKPPSEAPAPEPLGAEAEGETQEAERAPLTGPNRVIAQRMEESLGVPTATSVRSVPARLLEINRTILNRHLARHQGGKVSFTHLIGYAVARALTQMPGMNVTYDAIDGKPQVVRHPHVNLGLAIDVKRDDGTRTLLVPNIKQADTLDFRGFHSAYEQLIRKMNANEFSPDDFAGTTVTITNPGMLGTVQSVPRLMAGQAAIVGVGSIDYPAEFQGADARALADIGVGKVLTLTSTYDHRVIQGAESGEFLGLVHRLLLGEESFYESIFRSMGVSYVPVAWRLDVNP